MSKVQNARDAIGWLVADMEMAKCPKELMESLAHRQCLELCRFQGLRGQQELVAVGMWLWLLDLGTFIDDPEVLRVIQNYFTRKQ